MRIRSTKPEFWRSGRIAAVSWDARLVLKALESYVDDNGVGKDDLALIVGDLFQRDLVREPSRTLARVSEAISELHDSGLLWRYEANATNLLFIAFWDSVQRVDKPQSGRFPRPDGTWDYKASEIRESVVNVREDSRALAPGTGEQGNRGTGEELPSAPSARDAKFDEFWSVYPLKKSKVAARRRWDSVIKKVDPDAVIAGAVAYREQVAGKDPSYIKHPDGWLNAGRWEDEVAEQPKQAVPHYAPLPITEPTW